MKLAEARCDQRGCTFVATHARQGYANAILGKHKRKEHGIISPHQMKYGKPREPQEPTPEAAPPSQVTPNFCPNCGCNLRVITAALNLRRKS